MPVNNKANAIKVKVNHIFFEKPVSCLKEKMGLSESLRTVRSEILNINPTHKHTIPGTIKAARQFQNPVNIPATRGARTNPKLPNTPFTPRAVPLFEVLETSHAIPTG